MTDKIDQEAVPLNICAILTESVGATGRVRSVPDNCDSTVQRYRQLLAQLLCGSLCICDSFFPGDLLGLLGSQLKVAHDLLSGPESLPCWVEVVLHAK